MTMISRTTIFITLFILLFIYAPAGADTSVSGQSGELIKAIEIEGLTRIKKDELFMLIPLRVGDVLDPEELKAGIRRAFRKGIFLDIRAESGPYDGGIRLKYIVNEVPVITRVGIRGNRNIRSGNILKLFPMKEGDDFREEYLEKARSGLLDLYRRRGFHEAEISISVVKAKRARVGIKIYIKEGRPYIVKKIIAPEEARMHLPLFKGGILDLDVLDPAMEKIRKSYKEKGHIRPVVGPYEIKDGVLTVPVDPGPVLKLYFRGNSVISQGRLKKEVTFLEDEEVSDDIIEEVAENIKKLYMSSGYYYARIAAGIEYREGTTKVTFYIFEGQKVKLTKIDFTGMSISPVSVRGILSIKEGNTYDENLLEVSKDALTGFYNALGYLRMEVTDVVRTFQNNGAEITLEFVINEGPRTRIREIRIEGNNGIAADEIKEQLRLSEGDPYNMTDIGDARYRVLSLYGRRGYPDALVDVENRIDGENAFLAFRITENSPAVIGKIIVRGNRDTRTGVVSREFRAKEGDPYNYEEMLNVRQRLYNLGLFNEVAIEMVDTGRKADGRDVRDVLVSLKEGNAGSVELGIGYGDYEKTRGSFDITYRNVGGYNRQVGFRTELSSVEERYILNYREPRFLDLPDLPLNVFLMKEMKRSVNIDTGDVMYKIDRESLLFNVEKNITKHLKANLNYEYSFVDTQDVKPGVVLGKEDMGRIGIGSVSPSIFYDTRDNPFDPSSGSLHGIILKFANPVFFSETEFIKGIFQSSWFTQLRKGVVFALSFRGGAAYSFGQDEELPLVERFFLGGRTTVRGYSQDMLGPKGDDGTPTGGNMFVLGNGELRFSLGKRLGFVTFIDGGNVWQIAQDTQAKAKFTAGAGLRYNTPVGPVRFDYGRKIEKEEDESAGELHFSLGHAF